MFLTRASMLSDSPFTLKAITSSTISSSPRGPVSDVIRSVARDPLGMPAALLVSRALKRSPTLFVLTQIRRLDSRTRSVPAGTVTRDVGSASTATRADSVGDEAGSAFVRAWVVSRGRAGVTVRRGAGVGRAMTTAGPSDARSTAGGGGGAGGSRIALISAAVGTGGSSSSTTSTFEGVVSRLFASASAAA